MVAQMLMLVLLAAAAPVAPAAEPSSPSSGTAIVAEARATISRPLILQGNTIDTRAIGLAPIRQPPRRCASADSAAPECRLIVYDLP